MSDEEDESIIMNNNNNNNVFCNNCRKYGHVFNKCKLPVVSYGVILFRYRRDSAELEYLMICRRNTLGYIDFLRGKYNPLHKYYIMNMMKQMTAEEIHNIETKTFDELWLELWNVISKDDTAASSVPAPASKNNQYRIEEYSSRVKFNTLVQGVKNGIETFHLKSMLDEIKANQKLWQEPEWGFPKGRRHYQESEYHCAIREFLEETGIPVENIVPIYNLFPVEEMFIGSNYKSYKHKYFIMFQKDLKEWNELNNRYCSEVSQCCWKSLEECLSSIRPYNVEKKQLIRNVHRAIMKYVTPPTTI